MIKIAFFDIDWTLYDHASQRWIESGLEAIKKLQEKGIKVFVCSARPYNSQELFGVFDLGIQWDGYIASAGAIAVVGDKTVKKMLMKEEDVYKIIDKTKELGRTLEVVTPLDRFLIAPPDHYVSSYHYVYQYILPEIKDYKGEEATGLLLFTPESLDEEIHAVCPHLNWYRFHESGVDISDGLHEKGEAIQSVLDYLGLSKEEAISFGDDTQDISMARSTGVFVCMGNGKEEAKKAATFVTDRIENDGVEKALIKLGLIEK
ncbi:MAG: HAD-IIB family hydrolase [Bacilli bacterium]|nr:HAD-IIB family hydrolase [Bacilli bacterium]